MTKGLLRASAFCRPRKATPPLQVIVKYLAGGKRPRDSSETVYASIKLLLRLGIKEGDAVVLKPLADEGSSVQLTPIPFIVMIHPDETLDDDKAIYIAPTLLSARHSHSVTLQACPPNISTIDQVSVRLIGQPLSLCTDDSGAANEIPPIQGQFRPRYVSKGLLVPVWKEDFLFFFEVVEFGSPNPCLAAVVQTTESTTWKLLNDSLPFPRRLPDLERCAAYNEGVDYDSPPHPSLKKILQALRVPLSSDASQRIVHVVGTEQQHDVHVCVKTAAHQLGMRYIKVRGLAAYAHRQGHKVTTGGLVDQIEGCKASIRNAKRSAPCILHLVDLDREWLAHKNDQEAVESHQQRLWTCLMSAIKTWENESVKAINLVEYSCPVLVVASTTEALQDFGPFQRNLVWESVHLDLPDYEYCVYLFRKHGRSITKDDVNQLLMGRPALETTQIARLASKESNTPIEEVIKSYEVLVRGVSDRSKSNVPNIRWEDVGGLAQVRQEILDALELPMQHPELFRVGGRSGLLLYGPPGTGKTLVAKAVATEYSLPFFSIKGPELLDSYIGESEANVRKAFELASSPNNGASSKEGAFSAILFFDELDSLAPRRSDSAGSGVSVMDRVVATLLTELDRNNLGVKNHKPVFVMGATNRPDLLDPALLRPGRLDRLVYLGLPTESLERAQILAALIRKFRLEGSPLEIATEVVDHMPPRLSGADLAAIATEALMLSIRRLCNQAEESLGRTHSNDATIDKVLESWNDHELTPVVLADDLLTAANKAVPSIKAEEFERYERLKDEFNTA